MAIVRQDVKEEEILPAQKSLLMEAIEFCFLEFLSLHLSEFFEKGNIEEEKIVELARENIPQMLLENRILALLTTPIEDRQIFVKSGISKKPPKGEVHAIYASNGAVYERFHLTLPKGTQISRPTQGVIKLTHKRFTLTLTAKYHGFALNLPAFFPHLYVSPELENVDPRKVHFSLYASLQPTAFLYLKGWEYYQWIDSFVEYFEERVSFSSFLTRIDWHSVATRIRAGIIHERRLKKKKAQQNHPADPE